MTTIPGVGDVPAGDWRDFIGWGEGDFLEGASGCSVRS